MANEYLKRTPTSAGNGKVFTWAGWVKSNEDNLAGNGNAIFFVASANNGSNYHRTRIGRYVVGANDFGFNHYDGSNDNHATGRQLRDHSSWTHYMCTVDTSFRRGHDMVKLYINGALIQWTSTLTPSVKDLVTYMNQKVIHFVGADGWTTTPSSYASITMSDFFLVDGQELRPETFGFYKDGDGQISVGSTFANDFRNGQWVPRPPREIKKIINENGGFGVNGYYLPMNDSSNFGADFHCDPNSIIKLKGEDLPQPQNGAPGITTSVFVDNLRSDPYASNLVLAVPGIEHENTNPELVTNGDFSNGTTGWTGLSGGSLSVEDGKLKIEETTNALDAYAVNSTAITTEVGKRYTIKWTFHRGNNTTFTVRFGHSGDQQQEYQSNTGSNGYGSYPDPGTYSFTFTAVATTLNLSFIVNQASSYGYVSNVSVKEAVPVRDYSADIKGSGTNKTLTGISTAGIYPVPSYYGNAMRFDGSGDYLALSDSSDFSFGSGDFTIEAWVYPDTHGSHNNIFSTEDFDFKISSGVIRLYTSNGASGSVPIPLEQWSHVVVERNNSIITIFANGVAEILSPAAFTGDGSSAAEIGRKIRSSSEEFDGYIQDLRVYKGVAKYKGGFDVPKPYTPVGIGTWRTSIDTCKSNFATLNPLSVSADGADSTFNEFTLSEGNLRVTSTGTNHGTSATYSVSSGKWYWEYRMENFVADNAWMGVIDQDFGGSGGSVAVAKPSDSNYFPSGENVSLVVLGSGGNVYRGTSNPTGVSASIRNGDILGISLDLETDGNKEPRVGFYKNGVLQYTSTGSMSGNPTGFWRPAITFGGGSTGWVFNTNFGQNPSFGGRVTTGTYTDSNGRGLFKYEPPSGFLALCKDNLPEPTIKDPGKHFKALVWEGENTTQKHECGFKPDLVWIKNRDYTNWNSVHDVIRGPYVEFATNSTNGDRKRETADGIRSFFDTGFTSGADDNAGGRPDDSYVGWAWKGGGDPVPNTKGSLISQVSANPTAGFSIVGWTGDGTDNETVGHGLGKAPSFIILKPRTEDRNWLIWHEDMAGNDYAALFTNGQPASARFGPDAPTSDVFGVYGGQGNRSGCEMIAYCWTEIEGYSRIGEWGGNASTNGPYVYCGFKPAWLMYKRIDQNGDWAIVDNARSSENPVRARTFANLSNKESHLITVCDFTSNGFKIKTDAGSTNAQGGDYIFIAFAETPFKYANAK